MLHLQKTDSLISTSKELQLACKVCTAVNHPTLICILLEGTLMKDLLQELGRRTESACSLRDNTTETAIVAFEIQSSGSLCQVAVATALSPVRSLRRGFPLLHHDALLAQNASQLQYAPQFSVCETGFGLQELCVDNSPAKRSLCLGTFSKLSPSGHQPTKLNPITQRLPTLDG